MEIIINFREGKQHISTDWDAVRQIYFDGRHNISSIFIGDINVFDARTGIDIFLENNPPKYKSGIKFNNGKPKMSILFKQFPRALEAVVRCAEYGHMKYNIDGRDKDHLNYQRVEGGSQTYEDAGYRHLMKVGLDEESGLPHLNHAVWNFLATLELRIKEDENNQDSSK